MNPDEELRVSRALLCAARAARAVRGRAWLFCLALACGKGSGPATAAATPASGPLRDGGVSADGGDLAAEDPDVSDLWARAQDGGADDLARLELRIGTDGLVLGFAATTRRLAALRGLAYADDFDALPFLATVAASGDDLLAATALESVTIAAAWPRPATDPEDAIEVHEGSVRLLALAKDPTRPAARRVLAVRALRLLADRGWVLGSEIPTDLDAR